MDEDCLFQYVEDKKSGNKGNHRTDRVEAMCIDLFYYFRENIKTDGPIITPAVKPIIKWRFFFNFTVKSPPSRVDKKVNIEKTTASIFVVYYSQ